MDQKRQKRQLILDTNIIQYGTDKKYSDALLEVLESLRSKYEFAASSISKYEYFAGMSGKKSKKKIQEGVSFFRALAMIPINDDHLKIAAALTTSYKCNDASRSFECGVSFSDKLIGATAISLGACVLTGNSNDFLSPFFDEADIFTLKPSTEREQKISIVIPNIKMFNNEVKSIYKI